MQRNTLLVLAAALCLAPLSGCALSEAGEEISSIEGELGAGSAASSTRPDTVVDLAVSSPELTTLVEAVLKAELAGALGEEGPFTVFAPTNGAFAAFGINPADVDTETLTAVLLNHVVPGRFSARDLRRKARQGASLTTLGGLVLQFDRRPLTVNDIPVRFANRRAGNGIVHVVDGVLLEGGTTLVDQVRLRTELSTLLEAVAKASLADTLAGEGPFTVFAPDNGGFAAFGIDPEAVDEETLGAVLLNHVVAGRFSRHELQRLAWRRESLTTLGGLELRFPISGRGVNGLRIQSEVEAGNGLLQIINGVLLE